MSEKSRDVAVGLTVIVALVLMAGMILLFTGLPWFLQRGYTIKIAADTTHDTHLGDGVHLSGMRVGRVTAIDFADPGQPYRGVIFTARVDSGLNLPGNVRAVFFTRGLIGAAYIELKADGPERIDPATGKPLESFPTDGSIVMNSMHDAAGLVPDELTKAMESLTSLADNINELIAPSPQAQPSTEGATTAPAGPAGLKGTVAKLNAALDGIATVLGDAENQQNIKTSLANLAKATVAAEKAMVELRQFAEQARGTAKGVTELTETAQGRIDELAGKVLTSAEKVSELMATLNRIAMKIEAGEGTAGRLLDDGQLYDGLLQATREMTKLMAEFQGLVKVWQKDGIKLQMK